MLRHQGIRTEHRHFFTEGVQNHAAWAQIAVRRQVHGAAHRFTGAVSRSFQVQGNLGRNDSPPYYRIHFSCMTISDNGLRERFLAAGELWSVGSG